MGIYKPFLTLIFKTTFPIENNNGILFLSWWILILHDSNFLAQLPNTLAVFFLFHSILNINLFQKNRIWYFQHASPLFKNL